MISRWFSLTLFAVVIAPGLLRAQQQSNPYSDSTVARFQTPANSDKMYEDIEVFRRILDRKLQPLYPSHTYTAFGMEGIQGGMMGIQGGMIGLQGGGMMGMQGGMGGMASGMPGMQGGMASGHGMAGGMMPVVVYMRSLEGVYLKGQGVVYTATLSSLQPPGKTAKTEPTKPISEWESVRRQIRNEKEEPKKPEASKPPSLSDFLLKELSENGHHFSQLSENESLTIILTVHEPNPPGPARKSKRGRGSGGSAKTDTKSANSGGGSDLRGKISDLELLGDLHMKQGQHEEAIAAFQKAVELQPGPKEAAGLYRKLAQCYLAQGKIDSARAALDHYAEFLKSAQEYNEFLKSAEEIGNAEPKSSPAKPSAPALPVKLIISVPKKLLDEAKDGKLPFEEFRRRAHVETLRFGDRR